jgi:hypothetical protein
MYSYAHIVTHRGKIILCRNPIHRNSLHRTSAAPLALFFEQSAFGGEPEIRLLGLLHVLYFFLNRP